MLNENLNNLDELFSNPDNLEKDESAILEMIKVEQTEKGDYISEVDEARMEKAAEIMAEVFNKDVIANWREMSMDERAEKFNEYQKKVGAEWGIRANGVVFTHIDNEPGYITNGYNRGDGYVYINMKHLENPEALTQLLVTTTHEMRHQFQTDVISTRFGYKDIPKEVKKAWQYEFTHYISGSKGGFEAYANQGIEVDARKCGEEVFKRYCDKLQ